MVWHWIGEFVIAELYPQNSDEKQYINATTNRLLPEQRLIQEKKTLGD
jgi:hypothetical protein